MSGCAGRPSDDATLVCAALVAAFAPRTDRTFIGLPVPLQQAFADGLHEADDDALELVVAALHAAFASPRRRGRERWGPKPTRARSAPPRTRPSSRGRTPTSPSAGGCVSTAAWAIVTTAVTLATIIGFSGTAAASMPAVPGEALEG